MESPSQNLKKPKRRLWLKRLLIALFLIISIPLALFTIGWFNRDTIINEVQEWYNENHTGTLSIGKVNASFFRGFPKVGFTILDVAHTELDTITDKKTDVFIKEAKVVIGARDLLSGNVKFENISIKNATIFSEVIPEKPFDYYKNLKLKKKAQKPDSLKLHTLLNNDRIKLSLENVTFIIKDTTSNKHFDLVLHQVEGDYNRNEDVLSGYTDIDITVNALGFNTTKGVFLKDARVNGKSQINFDIKNQQISISEFPLQIDNQTFNLESQINVFGIPDYVIQLKNDATDFNTVKNLLSDSIAAKVKNYNILQPFESNLTLDGDFSYGNSPLINATFKSEENEIIIVDTYQLKNAGFSGQLTTDIYKSDKLKNSKKSNKDFRLEIDTLTADLDSIKVVVTNSYYQSSRESLNEINGYVQLEGKNEALARLIQTSNFDFEGGEFKLDTEIQGDILNVREILNSAVGEFYLENTRISLKKNGLQLPVKKIDLLLNKGDATLQKLAIQLPNGDYLTLNGTITNPAGLLSNSPITETTSSINLNSNDINIDEIISMATAFLPKTRTSVEDRKNLNESLEAVYNKFHPDFNINVGTLLYNGIALQDFKGRLELQNSETIKVNNVQFKYLDVINTIKGTVTVPEPNGQAKDPIKVQINANSEGQVTALKELFKIELLDVVSGRFNFEGNVSGNIHKFGELMQNARGNLNLVDNHYYYKPTDTKIQIDSLAVKVDNADILLNSFKLDLGDIKSIELSGSVKEFPDFLLDANNNTGAINLNVNIPYLDGDQLADMVATTNDTITTKTNTDKKDLHSVFSDLNYFDPSIELTIDSLKYRDLVTKDVIASMQFENDSTLSLEQVKIGYKNSQANIVGNIISTKRDTASSLSSPLLFNFKMNASGASKDLNDYLKTTNFVFETGDFKFDASYNGQANNLTLLQTAAKGKLKLGPSIVYNEAANLRIPVDSLNIEINNDVAVLNKLILDLPGKSSVDFSGTIDQFSNFIDNEVTDNFKSRFNIRSPYLNLEDVKTFLANTIKAEPKEKDTIIDLSKFKEALSGVNSSFNPKLSIAIDTLINDNIQIENLVSELKFNSDNHFVLEETSLQFLNSNADVNLEIGLQEADALPVKIDLTASDIDLKAFVSNFNYFNDEALKNTERIEGNLNMSIQADGSLNNEAQLDLSSLNGTATIELSNFELFDYQPLMDAVILLKEERFKQLKFRPIVQTFKIVNGEILIPRTEIQSSAVHLFIEGRLKLDEFINIWISSPWSNLKANDGISLPEKTTFEKAGAKFYIQLLQDKKHPKPKKRDLKVKVRLSDRKLRKAKKN